MNNLLGNSINKHGNDSTASRHVPPLRLFREMGNSRHHHFLECETTKINIVPRLM